MKRDKRGFWIFSSSALVLLLAVSTAPASAGPAEPRSTTTTADAEQQTVNEAPVVDELQITEAAEAARERRHIQPRQRSMRRSHRPLANPEQLLFGPEVVHEFAGAGHEYLQFDEIPGHARRRFLRTEGVLLTGYVGDNTYVAAVTPEGRDFLQSTPGIVAAGKIPVEDKVRQNLLDGDIPAWAAGDFGRVLVHVSFHETVALEEALRTLGAHGGVLMNSGGYPGFHVLDAAIDEAAVRDLARSDQVRRISMKSPEYVPFNAEAAALSKVDVLWDPPYNLSGAGYTVGIWDSGAMYPHAEIADRLTLMEWGDDPVDVAEIGFPDQQAIMVIEGHTTSDTYTITQNVNTTTIDTTTSRPCYGGSGPTQDHSWMRVFDLNIEHGIGELFCVDSVRYAVESAAGNPDVTFKVYCAPQHTANNDVGTIYWDDLNLQHTTTIDHPDVQMDFRDQPLAGCCDPAPSGGVGGYDLAIEITVEDCAESGNCDHFALGVNDAGQTKPTYYTAPDCEIYPVDPGVYAPHATHSAGTIGASGTLPATESQMAHGMANAVNLLNYDYWGFNQEYLDVIADGSVDVSHNGWGYDIGWYWYRGCYQADGCLPEVPAGWYYNSNTNDFGGYTTESWWVDYTALVAEQSGQPFPIIFAAGNERDDGPTGYYDGTFHYNPDEVRTYYDTINPLAGSKNAITVGAVDDDMDMTLYSSWGPCNDGRIKPDLVAKGHGLLSPVGALDYEYQIMMGTSMAAAVVSGSAVLVIEQYEDTFGVSPTNGEIKALLINSTIDLGTPGPDYIYGYGLLDGQQAVDTILSEGDLSGVYSGVVDHAQTDTYGVTVPVGTPELKVTLAWMDQPNAAPVPAIVNDLDLRLISPTGQSHYPFRLNVADPVAAATTGLNLRDTVEQVVIEDPEVGSWTVEVKGRLVPQGPQIYGLVSRNGMVAPTIYDILPPPMLHNFTYPYLRVPLSVKYTDLSGAGIDPASVTMRVNWFDVTDDAVITSEGAYYEPWYNLSELDEHWMEVTVTSSSGLQTNALSYFNYAQADEVADLSVEPGTSGRMVLAWGDPVYDPTKLLLKEYRVYRSSDLQQELEWIGTTTSHVFTDTSPPADGLVHYEVHALFQAGSLNEILSTRYTPHRTKQPFIAHPRDVTIEALPSGDFAIRMLGMSEPGSDVTVYVDGGEVGTTTTLEDGSFTYIHDFGGAGSHTVFVQAKAAGKSISVPSVEVDLELLP